MKQELEEFKWKEEENEKNRYILEKLFEEGVIDWDGMLLKN